MRQTLARVVPKVVLGGVLLVGTACLITGFSQKSDVDHAFDIHYGQPGSNCDSGGFLYLNTRDGKPLDCTDLDVSFGGGAVLPYINGKDSESLLATAKKLGGDGLSKSEQQPLQHEVDTFAAALPEKDMPYHYSGFWGVWMGVTGIVIIALGLALYFSPLRHRLESLLAGRSR